MDGMIKGYAAQLVLTHFDVALLGVVAAYAVVYLFAGPHRIWYRLPQLVLTLLLAYGASLLARLGIRYTTALLRRCLGDGGDQASGVHRRTGGGEGEHVSRSTTAQARSGRGTATAAAPSIDATATD